MITPIGKGAAGHRLIAYRGLSHTAPAYAQDLDPTFTGVHVEAVAGLDHIKGNGASSSGVAYGGNIGYDFATSGAVFGVEDEATFSNNRRCATGVIVG